MKHLTRLAALMVAATVFALPLGAQHRGHSSGHGSPSSSYSGGSHSSGSHSSGISHSSGSSRSSSSYSRSGSSSSEHRSPSHSSQSRSGSSSSVRQTDRTQKHSSGSSSSSSSQSSNYRRGSGSSSSHADRQRTDSGVRPSGGGNKPSGGPVTNGKPSGGNRPNPGSHSGSVDHRRPDSARPSGGNHSNQGVRPGNGVRPNPGNGHRPQPGSRPYAGGGHHPNPGHVHVNPTPGRHHHNVRPPRELRHHPVHFTHRGGHYYGHYILTPPERYRIYHYWGRDYYFYNDVWYRYRGGRYWVCRPPFGYVFSPVADAVYTACSIAYFFDSMYYYDTINDNARLIVEQNNTIAANNALIAQQNADIALNASRAQASGNLANSLGLVQSYASAGTEYFYNDGVFYVKDADGQYTVIVPPAGAQIDSLPEDYELIELGGNTYYKVDDTVYRMAVSADGKACFEVLGQLTQE